MIRVTIHGYGLCEGKKIRGTVVNKPASPGNFIRVKVPCFGKSFTWEFLTGSGFQRGKPISGYQILPEDLKRIAEHSKTP